MIFMRPDDRNGDHILSVSEVRSQLGLGKEIEKKSNEAIQHLKRFDARAAETPIAELKELGEKASP